MRIFKTLWGCEGRYPKVIEDIKRQNNHAFKYDYTCLTYGIKNHELLIDMGVNSLLIHDEARMFKKESEFAHKLWAIVEASHICSSFIYCDHDVFLSRPLEPIEPYVQDKVFLACLRIYHNKKVKYKTKHPRKLPCASLMYCATNPATKNNCAKDIWNIYKQLGEPWREELALRKFVEVGGELDLDYYEKNYESTGLFKLKNSGVIKNTNDSLFVHLSKDHRD